MAKAAIAIGAALVVFGLVFQLQGRGQLGPESSFMYHNEDWIYYGVGIVVAGLVTSGIGFFLRR